MINTNFVRTHSEKFKYLFCLQRQGSVNMHGAAPYLIRHFNLTRGDAKDLLAYWCTNYEEIAAELGIEI